MIEMKYDSVTEVILNRGDTNALNLALVEELVKILHSIKGMSDVRAVVLRSANEKFFSIGFDISELFEIPRDEFREFYSTFNQACFALFSLPKPIVACISGHAIAGGCILALCCDYRVISSGRKLMGLNEIKLGLPVPYLADRILQNIIGTREARNVMESGEFFEADELLKRGMVDDVAPQAEVMERAKEKAESLASMPSETYRIIKENRIEDVVTRVETGWEERQEQMVEMWYSDEARKQLWNTMKKFKKV